MCVNRFQDAATVTVTTLFVVSTSLIFYKIYMSCILAASGLSYTHSDSTGLFLS